MAKFKQSGNSHCFFKWTSYMRKQDENQTSSFCKAFLICAIRFLISATCIDKSGYDQLLQETLKKNWDFANIINAEHTSSKNLAIAGSFEGSEALVWPASRSTECSLTFPFPLDESWIESCINEHHQRWLWALYVIPSRIILKRKTRHQAFYSSSFTHEAMKWMLTQNSHDKHSHAVKRTYPSHNSHNKSEIQVILPLEGRSSWQRKSISFYNEKVDDED